MLEAKGDIEMLRRVRQIGDMAQISYVRQKEQLGLGHAVLMAKELVGHEPFAVILSDDVVQAERSCIGQLIDAYQHTGGSTLAVMPVPFEETSRYGVVDVDESWTDPDERLNRIRAVVEKPPADPPSNKAIIGRYVLTPKIFEKLEQTQAGSGGEIQLTDAIEALMEEQEVFSYAFEGTRHDAGTTMGWLKASVQLALDRDDIGREFRDYLAGIDLQ
jgi:UTP--glucose-1-phosphate uridylyltransferase